MALDLKCGICKKSLDDLPGFFCCDVTMMEYCEDCWVTTDCFKGKHGEGCETMVWSIDD